jgi:hypothetical protein
MSTALIVGGDQIDGIKQVLGNYGITHIDHWSGRKVGDSKRAIPQDTQLIVLITDWISHTFTHNIKRNAAKRGVRIVYTPNGPTALRTRLERLHLDVDTEGVCRKTLTAYWQRWLARLKAAAYR